MPLVWVIIVIAGIGFLLWVIDRYVPMDPTVKRFLLITAILVLAFWLLKLLGVWEAMLSVKV